MPAIGVLMSVYERDDPAPFEAALQSVLNQRLPSGFFTRLYLGVDGPVPPALSAMIDKYRPRIHVCFESETNRGLAPVLNDLINRIDDERFLFRMDADDRSLPERFARQIAYMEAHPDIDVLGTAIVEHDISSGRKRVVRFAPDPATARRDMAKRAPLAHPTACFRRRVFEIVSGYPVVPFSEDVALWFRCLQAGLRFDNLPEPLYEFTISANFWRRRGIGKAWNEYRTWSRGVHALHGITWRQIYPFARLLMRLGPRSLQRLLYSRVLRRQASYREEATKQV